MATERLKQMVQQKLEMEKAKGRGARERLAAQAQVSMSTLQNALKGRPVSPVATYRLALACDARETEAQRLAGSASAEAKTA